MRTRWVDGELYVGMDWIGGRSIHLFIYPIVANLLHLTNKQNKIDTK